MIFRHCVYEVIVSVDNDDDNDNTTTTTTTDTNTNNIVHQVSIRKFPSFRTQLLESLSVDSVQKWIPEQPSPWRTSSKRESCYGDRVYPTRRLSYAEDIA